MIKKSVILLFLIGFILINPVSAKRWWEVYFTEGTPNTQSNTDIEIKLAELINGAQYSVDIVSYTWGTAGTGNSFVRAINNAYNRGLTVRLVGDGEREINPNINASIPRKLRDNNISGSGIQHNKLIIIDYGRANAKVVGGSANWTTGAMSAQYNNILIITDQNIVSEYHREFEEMFLGTFNGGASGNNSFDLANNARAELYFSSEDNWMYNKFLYNIKSAQKSAIMLANNLTKFSYLGSSDAIASAFIQAKSNGAVVEGTVDDYYYNYNVSKSTVDNLASNGIDMRVIKNPNNVDARLHNKIVIIDGELVITGSANFTMAAQQNNDENQIYIRDPILAREYLKHYRKLMKESDIKTANPTFEEVAPSNITGVIGKAQGDGIKLTWDKCTSSDFDRYFIYISTSPILDVSNLRPEIGILTDKNQVSYTVNTVNNGDSLTKGTTYYLAVTAADVRGNESLITNGVSNTEGILYTGLVDGAWPIASISFDTGASQIVKHNSTLIFNLRNGESALREIIRFTIDLSGDSSNPFTFTTPQPYLQGMDYILTENQITFYGMLVYPGDTLELKLAVKNPKKSGVSNSILLNTIASNGEDKITSMSGLPILPTDFQITAELAVASGQSVISGETTQLKLTLKNTSIYDNRLTSFCIVGGYTTTSQNYKPVFSDAGLQPSNSSWKISNANILTDSSSQIYFTATNAGLSPGNDAIVYLNAILPTKLPQHDTGILYIVSDGDETSVIEYTFKADIKYADKNIIINEFMYNPLGDYDKYLEYVELRNLSDLPFDISGWKVNCNGTLNTFPNGSIIEANGYIIMASILETKDETGKSFAAVYGNKDGVWNYAVDGFQAINASNTFDLNDNFGYIEIQNATGSYKSKVDYNDAYPMWVGADGTGSSFEKISSDIEDEGNAIIDGNNYQASSPASSNGSPGYNNVSDTTLITGLNVKTTTINSITLSWNPLQAIRNFNGYKIYYSTTSPVTTLAGYWTKNSDSELRKTATNQTVITNLAPSTKYYFVIVPVINNSEGRINNVYEVSGTTGEVTPVEDLTVSEINDGVTSIYEYNGTKILKDKPLVVKISTSSEYTDVSDFYLYYEVNKIPDGTNVNRRVGLTGQINKFQAVISSWDPDIVDGVTINFIIKKGTTSFYHNKTVWSFKIEGMPIDFNITGVTTRNTGKGEILVRWNPVTHYSYFKQYKIYYNMSDTVDLTSSVWSSENDKNLAIGVTNSTVIKGLQQGKKYGFKVVLHNNWDYECDLTAAELVYDTPTATGNIIITEVLPALSGNTDAWVELYCYSGQQDLTGYRVSPISDLSKEVDLQGNIIQNNSYLKINLGRNYFKNDDGIVLYTEDGAIINCVFWSNKDGNLTDTVTNELNEEYYGAALWNMSSYYKYSSDQGIENTLVYLDTSEDYSISRKMHNNSNYYTNNNLFDWELCTIATPEAINQVTNVVMNYATDGNKTISNFYLEDSLFDTDVAVNFRLTNQPRDINQIRLYYNVNREASGSSADTELLTVSASADNLTRTAIIPKTGVSNGKIYFLIKVDGKIFRFNNSFCWSYTSDNEAPSKITGLTSLSKTLNSVNLTWNYYS
ncbi:lamin tail domain-containing protein, partial [Candidatus Dependentiae bacterium]|nr:lamin tail domain-containing protein [Candidatus Dependentiae bacterium]